MGVILGFTAGMMLARSISALVLMTLPAGGIVLTVWAVYGPVAALALFAAFNLGIGTAIYANSRPAYAMGHKNN